MDKLTKRKALQICYELWMWLYHHPSKDKDDWPYWKKYDKFTKKGYMYNDCPCCEYHEQQYLWGTGCADPKKPCPLLMLWPRGCGTTENSPWNKWHGAKSPKTRKKYALIITNAAKTELERKK